MKSINYLLILSFAVLTSFSKAMAQDAATDSTGLPGDNFSLQGALQMFQKAGSPEEFEKLINAQDNIPSGREASLELNGRFRRVAHLVELRHGPLDMAPRKPTAPAS